MNTLREHVWLVVAVTVCLVIYANCSGSFFLYDSGVAIRENNAIRFDGSDFDSWRLAALSSDSGPLGRPIPMLSFALNYLVNPDADGLDFRLTNILVHCLTGLLLYACLFRLLICSPVLKMERSEAMLMATLAAVFWILHPLHVTTVLYSVQRMAQFATLASLLGLWWYLRERSRWLSGTPGVEDYSRMALGLVLFTLLAGFSKENGLLLPWLLAVVEWIFFRFLTRDGPDRVLQRTVQLGFVLPVLAFVASFALFPGWLQDWYSFRDFTLEERLLTQPRVLWGYIFQLLLPNIATMSLHHDQIQLSSSLLQPVTTMLSLLAWSGLLVLLWFRGRDWPLFSFALLWFLVANIMESSFVPLLMAFEHRNYLASFGIFLWLAVLLVRHVRPAKLLHRLVFPLAIIVLGGLLLLRASSWTDELTLAHAEYRHQPESPAAAFMLARTYYNLGISGTDPELGQKYFAAADRLHRDVLALKPDFVPSLVALLYISAHSSGGDASASWYRQIEQSLLQPPLSQVSLRYLPVLTDCVAARECGVEPEAYLEFLDVLAEQEDARVMALDMKVRLCMFDRELGCVGPAIEQVLAETPDSSVGLRSRLTLLAESGDNGAALERTRELMARDPQRRNLLAVKDFIGEDNVGERAE